MQQNGCCLCSLHAYDPVNVNGKPTKIGFVVSIDKIKEIWQNRKKRKRRERTKCFG